MCDARGVRSHTSHWPAVFLVVVAAAITPSESYLAASPPPDRPGGPSRYAITGVVRDADTGRPVRGAVIAFTDFSLDFVSGNLIGVTDADGRYHTAAPPGELKEVDSRLPPGFWMRPVDRNTSVLLTPEEPVATRGFELLTGPVWRIRVDGPLTPFRTLSMIRRDDAGATASATDESKADDPPPYTPPEKSTAWAAPGGRFELTQPGDRGRFVFSETNLFETPPQITVPPGFDNAHVRSYSQNGDDVTLTDHAGRVARLRGGLVELEDGRPTIVLRSALSQPKSLGTQVLRGLVTGPIGPVSGARVHARLSDYFEGGRTLTVLTDERGRYEIECPVVLQEWGIPGVWLTATAEGCVESDGSRVDLTDDLRPLTPETIRLRSGHTVRVHVVNEAGRDVVGAYVGDEEALEFLVDVQRTGENGRVLIPGLAAGVSVVKAEYDRSAGRGLFISGPNAADEITIQVAPVGDRVDITPRFLEVGRIAPPWFITSWTDGRFRTPADTLGRVVVLQFLDPGDGPEVWGGPVIARLERAFTSEEVAFFGVLAPGFGLEDAARIRVAYRWQAPIGIDDGGTSTLGQTAFAYGGGGCVVIGRGGQVVYDEAGDWRRQDPTILEGAARRAGLEWPIPPGTPLAEANRRRAAAKAARIAEIIRDELAE